MEMADAKFCPNCGSALMRGAKFCPHCGVQLAASPGGIQPAGKGIGEQAKEQFSSLVDSVNHLTGGTDHVELRMSELFSNVLGTHSKQEAEAIFIAGTATTTPPESEISTAWPRPWLYSRVFVVLAVTFGVLLFMSQHFGNPLVYPGAVFLGALCVPFSLLVFFFEVNAPRNISIFSIVTIFFIGGVISLLMTLVLYQVVGIRDLTNGSAFLVGIVEELGKIIVVAYFLKDAPTKYILNGLLIGAAVGAGFAVFETAGYINMTKDVDVLYLRGITSLGTHTAWTALAGAALAMVKKDSPLTTDHLTNVKFLQFLAIAIVLHGVWDMPASNDFSIPVVQFALIAVVWLFLLVMIHAGLRQISEMGGYR